MNFPQQPTPDPVLLYRLRDVCVAVGLSRSTVYELVKTGRFPPPIRVATRGVRWRRSDVERWASSRPVAARLPHPESKSPTVHTV